jgi:hypothetical protein
MSTQRTRLTSEQSEEIRQIVLGGILANRTVNETLNIIDRRLNVKLAVDTIKYLRMKVKKQALDELQIMKMDNDTYIFEYLQHIYQIKDLIKRTNEIAERNESTPWIHLKCLNDIHDYTKTLHKLYDFLPSVCSMKIFDNELVPHVNYDNNKLNIQ